MPSRPAPHQKPKGSRAGRGRRTRHRLLYADRHYSEVRRLGDSSSTRRKQSELIQDVAEHAIVRLGGKGFASWPLMIAYGNEMTRAFRRRSTPRRGVDRKRDLQRQRQRFRPAIKRIKAADLMKYGKLETIAKKGKSAKTTSPGFDAIFVPDDVDKVASPCGPVAFLRTLGPDPWNKCPQFSGVASDRRTISRRRAVCRQLFRGQPESSRAKLVDRYRARFHEAPTAFAAQAYEATPDSFLSAKTQGRDNRQSHTRKFKKSKTLQGSRGI